MNNHRGFCPAIIGLWTATVLSLCASPYAAAATKTNGIDFTGLAQHYNDSLTVSCQTTASHLSDYMVDDGSLDKNGQAAFIENAEEQCDYTTNPQQATKAAIGYQARLNDYLMTDINEDRALEHTRGLDGILTIVGEELCTDLKLAAKKLGLLQKSERNLCQENPILGVHLFAERIGFQEYNQQAMTLSPYQPNGLSVAVEAQKLTLPAQ